jgi:hypothetical protein
MTFESDVPHCNSASVTGISCVGFLFLSPALPNLLLILAAGNPLEYKKSLRQPPFAKQRTESIRYSIFEQYMTYALKDIGAHLRTKP